MALDGLFVDLLRRQAALLHLTGNGAHGVSQLGAAAVVQAEVDNALLIVLCQVHHIIHRIQHTLLQPLAATAEQHLTAALIHFLGDGAEVVGKQIHQVADFLGIAGKILRRKHIQRQHLYAAVAHGIAGDFPQAVKTRLVTNAGGHKALARPAAVAVHNDGDVLGNAQFFVRHRCSPFLCLLLPGHKLLGRGFSGMVSAPVQKAFQNHSGGNRIQLFLALLPKGVVVRQNGCR